MQSQRLLDLWVGVFIVIGLSSLLFLALKAANASSFSNDAVYRVIARFDNIGGLKVRAPVKSAGVVVGRVTDISLDTEKFQAMVTLSVNAKYPFPKDTSAKILTSGLLGEQYLGLAAGGDTVNLKDGDTLMLTQSAVVLENLVGQFLFNKAAEGSEKK